MGCHLSSVKKKDVRPKADVFLLCFGEQVEEPGAAVIPDHGEIRVGPEALQPHLSGPSGDVIAPRCQQRIPDLDRIALGRGQHDIVPGIGKNTDPVLPVTGCDFDEVYMPNRTQIRM